MDVNTERFRSMPSRTASRSSSSYFQSSDSQAHLDHTAARSSLAPRRPQTSLSEYSGYDHSWNSTRPNISRPSTIQLSAPSRIIFMTTACPPNNPSTLFSLIQDLLPETQIDAMERSAWSETEGLEYIHNLAFKDDIKPLKVATQGKFYAISSLAALIIVPTNADVQQVEEQINQVLMIKSFLESIPELHTALGPANSVLLTKDLEVHGLDADLRYDNGRKYWLRLRAADFDDRPLPDLLINVVRKKDKIECQTLDLVKLNLRLSDTSNEVVIRSDKVVQDLLKELRSDVPHLFRVCESVALVDMISSFAQLATTRDYVKPDLSTTLALKAARHPVLDKSNLSTFSVEMREMSFILRNIDDKSLAVIDELGRATSNRDGLAIAIAMSEALIQSRASVWFATHYIDLTKVLADRPGILNLHLAATTSTTEDGLPHITMLYKATSGATRGEEHYGINLARAIGLPQSFIDKAEEVAKDIRRRRETTKRSSESTRLVARRKLILNLQNALRRAKDSGSKEALPGYLQLLQEDFVARMEEVDNM
ncbi:hypothetical protein FOXG_08704 [Fusarium oxysporum f. sp. lycopersici 4287]|uniref:DNA mismatch repair proteins mutS family domain-containing protein n=2 Tax=Fusarium oxysporum TaxID=5507 RepID=A0A0J9V7R7_FUSO4|nr:hypothetical protein FOXG_08704 [Fusarium oxysporum f. sp. lycopersici 4287]KNB07584.1 hypothetical protein FOXG_08704 [Fusarium oxysporum f. sp. lycopersici 4287]